MRRLVEGLGRAIARTEPLFALVRLGVYAMAALAGLGLVTMMVVTCTDVVLRLFDRSLTGAVDLVTLAGAVTVSCALPYTTAVKGHVAIEFFFHKLGRGGRVVVDSLVRLGTIAMFSAIAWACVLRAGQLRRSGTTTMTLAIPVFWVPYVIAAASGLVVLVILGHLLHPGKELIKP